MNLEKAQALIDYLKIHDLNVVLAGGACRDTFHGLRPKDWDFFVLGENGPREVRNKLRAAGLNWHYCSQYGEARDNPEYKGVFKAKIGADVDFILWENPANNVQEVVDNFDLTLNQYWMEDGEIRHRDNAPHIIGRVEVLREDSTERTRRILSRLMYNE